MTFTLEFLTFPASAAFIEHKGKSFQPIIDELKRRNGCLQIYTGVQVEDGKTGYLLIIWESYDIHKVFIDDPDYGKIVQDLLPGFNGKLEDSKMQHILFRGDPSTALAAPVTEFAFFVLGKDVKQEVLVEGLHALSVEGDKANTKHAPSTYGEVREHPNTFVLTLGWDSVEAHIKAVSDGAPKKAVDHMLPLADISFKHVRLTRDF